MTVPRWQVLSILSVFDGARVGRVVEMSGQEQPVVTRLIDQMQRDGLVVRKKAPDDNRAVEVWITDDARALLETVAPAAMDYVGRLIAPLDEDEQQTLMGMLARVLNHLEAPPPSPPA